MAVQALYDSREHGHLVGDVPALLLVAFVLWFLSPTNKVARRLAVASSLQDTRHSEQDCMDIFDRVQQGGSNVHRPLSAEAVAFEKGSWGLGKVLMPLG
jgi:hypothetical protein